MSKPAAVKKWEGMVSQERLKEVLAYDPDTGIFTRIIGVSRFKAGSIAGTKSTHQNGKRYRSIRIDGTIYQSHRLAFLYMTGAMPEQVDHIDGNGLNNTWGNLRGACAKTNSKNQRRSRANTSGHTGVSFNKKLGKWVAEIKVDRVKKHLGVFESKEQAALVRKKAEGAYGFHENHGSERPL